MTRFIIKGDVCYSKNKEELICIPNGYLVCVDGYSKGVYTEIPKSYQDLDILDYTGKLIVPGCVDLHIHAPQYAFRGTKMDLELMDWLNQNAFLEEVKYQDLNYALNAYRIFVEDLKKSATTRACIFATKHAEATVLLMKQLEESGLITYVGKVNMDQEAPSDLLDKNPKESILETKKVIQETKEFVRTKPILTPRFIPCCSRGLLEELNQFELEYHLPVQSHLSENPNEIAFVHQLYPEFEFYGDGYDRYHLFGKPSPTIMAHCVWSTEEEVERMRQNNVFIAHCPASNMNLSSGVAPIRAYFEKGINMGLGTDIGAGQSNSIFRTMIDAIQASKLYWRLVDQTKKPLNFNEAFYLATLGGGAFFGRVGSFLEGYEMDALVLNDEQLSHPQKLTLAERLERFAYLAGDLTGIEAKFVAGKKII